MMEFTSAEAYDLHREYECLRTDTFAPHPPCRGMQLRRLSYKNTCWQTWQSNLMHVSSSRWFLLWHLAQKCGRCAKRAIASARINLVLLMLQDQPWRRVYIRMPQTVDQKVMKQAVKEVGASFRRLDPQRWSWWCSMTIFVPCRAQKWMDVFKDAQLRITKICLDDASLRIKSGWRSVAHCCGRFAVDWQVPVQSTRAEQIGEIKNALASWSSAFDIEFQQVKQACSRVKQNMPMPQFPPGYKAYRQYLPAFCCFQCRDFNSLKGS